MKLHTGELYHVFNRGVDKRDIFITEGDYLRFYQSMAFFNTKNATQSFLRAKEKQTEVDPLVIIVAYALLKNHFHLILKQVTENGVSEFMRRISTGYTSYFNERNKRTGSLFQGKFKRVHIESEEHFQYVLAYVNENHHVHGIAGQRKIYQTSSLHYQRIQQSMVMDAGYQSMYMQAYDAEACIALAKEIYKKRASIPAILELD